MLMLRLFFDPCHENYSRFESKLFSIREVACIHAYDVAQRAVCATIIFRPHAIAERQEARFFIYQSKVISQVSNCQFSSLPPPHPTPLLFKNLIRRLATSGIFPIVKASHHVSMECPRFLLLSYT